MLFCALKSSIRLVPPLLALTLLLAALGLVSLVVRAAG